MHNSLYNGWHFTLFLLVLIIFFPTSIAEDTAGSFKTKDQNGNTVWLMDSREPSLYTGDFGDCNGSGKITLTHFDAAFYRDNMTVTFHLAGTTTLEEESIVVYLGIFAYGKSYFPFTFDPCQANIQSLCPIRNNASIEASGVLSLNDSTVAAIPNIIFRIPDFEGQAILRIYGNSTQSEIGCFSATVTNGHSFSHPVAVGIVLGTFTVIAMIASFGTTIYGESIPVIRTHYAHSMSVMVVFAVFHHIFFTGALSVNWPSVLVAFWSNYAWAGGMIYWKSMQNMINRFIGTFIGDTLALGAAGTGKSIPNIGGGYDVNLIYRKEARGLSNILQTLTVRDEIDAPSDIIAAPPLQEPSADFDSGYRRYGNIVRAGFPIPGNFSGFAGTLGERHIPASNAFLTGLMWFLILAAAVATSVVIFKVVLESLVSMKVIRSHRFGLFRAHWKGYTILAILRTCLIGFFMLIFLSLFQFTYQGSVGVTAISTLVYVIFFLGIFGATSYACCYRIRVGKYVWRPDRIYVESVKKFNLVPWIRFRRAGRGIDQIRNTQLFSFPIRMLVVSNPEVHESIHHDIEFTTKFGWLFSRFRRTRWWFFVIWVAYEFIRACFLGTAAGYAKVQIFGILAIEVLAFSAIIALRPFEGQRLNAMVVYLLGFSKVATIALSITFDIQFNAARVPATVIGIAIIVIQGVLTVVLLFAIIIGAISTFMALGRIEDNFKPMSWAHYRELYFKQMDSLEKDTLQIPVPPSPAKVGPKVSSKVVSKAGSRTRKEPYFNVTSVRRVAKIEDEDPEFAAEITTDLLSMNSPLPPVIEEEDEEMEEIIPEKAIEEYKSPERIVVRAVSVSTAGSSQSSIPVGHLNRLGSTTSSCNSSTASLHNSPYGPPNQSSWCSRDYSEFSWESSREVSSVGHFLSSPPQSPNNHPMPELPKVSVSVSPARSEHSSPAYLRVQSRPSLSSPLRKNMAQECASPQPISSCKKKQ